VAKVPLTLNDRILIGDHEISTETSQKEKAKRTKKKKKVSGECQVCQSFLKQCTKMGIIFIRNGNNIHQIDIKQIKW
jgi:hypothetical protein